jgi:hypothetical protein
MSKFAMRPYGSFLLATLISLIVAPVAHAQSDAEHVLDAMFYNFDENRDGVIDSSEADRFIGRSFAEMDPGHSGQISRASFRVYSFGLADVAAQQGDTSRYNSAKDAIFNGWSHGAATLSRAGYRAGVLADARAALRVKRTGKRRVAALRIDHAAFGRIPFIRRLMNALH